MSKYQRIVEAAIAESRSKKALAEALALEIPAKDGRDADTYTQLGEALEAIIAAGGEPKAVKTLAEYRLTARWVAGVSGYEPVNGSVFAWVDGASLTAHSEARMAGMSLAEFKAEPKTARQLRMENKAASKDGDPVGIVDGWSPEQRKQAAERLAKVEPDAVVEAVVANPDLYDDAERRMPRVETPPRPERKLYAETVLVEVNTHFGHAATAIENATSLIERAIREGVAFDDLEFEGLGIAPEMLDSFIITYRKTVAMVQTEDVRA